MTHLKRLLLIRIISFPVFVGFLFTADNVVPVFASSMNNLRVQLNSLEHKERRNEVEEFLSLKKVLTKFLLRTGIELMESRFKDVSERIELLKHVNVT